jgi:phosphoribosyl 1,2-cyclic phosphodiesterase
MPVQFTVLASGSSGNASLLQVDGFGLLLDAGLGPRQLGHRLMMLGASWRRIQAVLLTHTHSDHWRDTTLAELHRQRIPLYCHAEHQEILKTYGQAFDRLRSDRLVRLYDPSRIMELAPGVWCRPIPLPHDGGPTFGFRFEATSRMAGLSQSLAYAADLGSWDVDLAQQLADVDLLALEFNHDVGLERASGRSPFLIDRVLSARGHLSNVQAVGLLKEAVRRSRPGRLKHVVQLHLSRDCNRPALAAGSVRAVFPEADCRFLLHTSSQFQPMRVVMGHNLRVPPPRRQPEWRQQPAPIRASVVQPWLPGMEEYTCRADRGMAT